MPSKSQQIQSNEPTGHRKWVTFPFKANVIGYANQARISNQMLGGWLKKNHGWKVVDDISAQITPKSGRHMVERI